MNLDHWTAFPAGILIASFASAIGIGGGILWMPFFLIALNISPEKAVLSSLLIQAAGMGSSSVAFLKQKRVDVKLGIFLMAVTVPGVLGGAYIATRLKPSHLEVILGLIAMTTAFLFVSSNQKYDDKGMEKIEIRKAYRYSWIISLLSMISGLLSVSIGEWLVPILKTRLSMTMSRAIATSIFVIFGTCIIGVSSHLILGGKAEISAVLWGVPGVMIGGQIGPRIIRRINERILKEMFVFVLTLFGIHLIYNSF
ncbi:MAG: hypothetical protein BWK80_16175 [Desulfobacteraceae bacterium IS3]|nr:MAG: hypothetical protein BWK80_16175 [Desulfobacteraceae bacterium IS3]